MPTKPRLLYHKPLTLNHQCLNGLPQKFFDLMPLHDASAINSTDCLYIDEWDVTAVEWAKAGRKIVLDCLWEPKKTPEQPYGCHVLQNLNWLWYQESNWYRHLGYDQYVPQRQWQYQALMPIRRQKPARDFVVKYIGSNIDRFLWSYQEKGRNLPNSTDFADWSGQRLFREEWYNSCAMSLVIETLIEDDDGSLPLLSEKTYKAIAFCHPFVICGDRRSLTYLKVLGFETFDNLFDEGYDQIRRWIPRCRAAVDQCLNTQFINNHYDSVTEQKIKHNHDLFFNQSLVEQKIIKEILEPMLDYAET